MEAFLRHPELAATAGHLAVVQRKLERLTTAKQESWEQLMVAVGRMYRAGELAPEDLLSLMNDMAAGYGTGYTALWDDQFGGRPISAKRLAHHVAARARLRRDHSITHWSGTFPLCGQDAPRSWVAVVYVLYDETNEPVYVGSTDNFHARMSGHHARKLARIVRWSAYRCNDREHAYEVEERLLAEHKPRLNKKTTR